MYSPPIPHGMDQAARWPMLPEHGKTEAQRIWWRRGRYAPGPGDNWVYDFTTLAPPAGYVGPLPFCVVTGRRRV